MLETIQRHLLGVLVVASPLIVGFLWCVFLWRKRRHFSGQRPNGLVWLSSWFK